MDGVSRDRAKLCEIENIAAAIVQRAGDLVLERFISPIELEFKDEKRTDPVTAVDRAVERLVRDEVASAFPTHGFLGEEGTASDGSTDLLWVLDPIDGTANFAGKLPLFGVSLSLLRNGVPIVGCLFVPLGPTPGASLFRASLGNGARAGDTRLAVDHEQFKPARPVALPPGITGAFQISSSLRGRMGEARNLGSICHELAMVACGAFRYAVFAAPHAWDVAAGILLVREAGGIALVWERGAWRRFDRFVPPPPRQGKSSTLRDWRRPILVGAPGAVRHVSPHLTPRTPPPRAVRWLLSRPASTRQWWRSRRKQEAAAAAPT